MGTLARQHDILLSLLLDEELRERFFTEREEVARELELDEEDLAVFGSASRHGLELDARIRREYLMSALCRPFPLTAAALGSAPRGREALCAFLTSHHLRAELGARTAAFGDHLARLLDLNGLGLSRELLLLIGNLLTLERARVDVAADLRAAVERGEAPASPHKPTASHFKRRGLALPPFFIAHELPMPMGVLETALDHAGAHNAWQLIDAGRLSLERLRTVARALPMPVTVVSRGIARGTTLERAGAGGVSPLVDVRHLVAEVRGRHQAAFEALDGTQTLSDLPTAWRRVARPLAEQGLLVLAEDEAVRGGGRSS